MGRRGGSPRLGARANLARTWTRYRPDILGQNRCQTCDKRALLLTATPRQHQREDASGDARVTAPLPGRGRPARASCLGRRTRAGAWSTRDRRRDPSCRPFGRQSPIRGSDASIARGQGPLRRGARGLSIPPGRAFPPPFTSTMAGGGPKSSQPGVRNRARHGPETRPPVQKDTCSQAATHPACKRSVGRSGRRGSPRERPRSVATPRRGRG